MALTLRQLAFPMLPTLRQFVFVIVGICLTFCIAIFILEVLVILLPSSLATALDTATGGSPPLRGISWQDMNFSNPFKPLNITTYIKARVQNTTAMPPLCREIIPLDTVANISVVETCIEWCHEALGPNSAAPYMLSWLHVLLVLAGEQGPIYLTCWKTQIATWALKLMPEWYWIYLPAMVYGLWSVVAFLWTFCHTKPQTIPGGPAQDHVTPDGPYGRICGDIPCCCLPVRSDQSLPLENGWNEAPLCYPASSDRNGSEIGLKIAAFCIVLEPFGDITSVFTLLRIGQPFPAAFMAFGIALACAVGRDPLQLSGARAVAESLRKGFETRALLQHKSHEFWESYVCATVQAYILMSFHPKFVTLSTGLNLLVSASVNLVISIPAQIQAGHVIRQLKDSEWTFAKIVEAKRSPRLVWMRRFVTWQITLVVMEMVTTLHPRPSMVELEGSQSPLSAEQWCMWLFRFLFRTCHLEKIGELWSILCDPETWQQWLLAFLLICFRLPFVCIMTASIIVFVFVSPLLIVLSPCWLPLLIVLSPGWLRLL